MRIQQALLIDYTFRDGKLELCENTAVLGVEQVTCAATLEAFLDSYGPDGIRDIKVTQVKLGYAFEYDGVMVAFSENRDVTQAALDEFHRRDR